VVAAGFSFPFPQREVRVLGASGAGKHDSPRPGGGIEPSQKE
jgi:hypothetical protein